MKKFGKVLLIIMCSFFFAFASVNQGVYAHAEEETLYIGGIPIGFTIKTQGVTVIGFSDIVTDEGIFSPAKNGDIRVGDVIVSIGGKSIDGASSVSSALASGKGDPLEVKVLRDDREMTKYIMPAKDKRGVYKLGVLIRDDLNGIGTLSFFKENGDFGALGHPVLDENEKKIRLYKGEAYLCSVIGVIRGERGKAGELKGIFLNDQKVGSVTKCNDCGLYGSAYASFDYKKYPKTTSGEAVIGKATMMTCIDGDTPKEYQISIVKIENDNRENKNLVISIMDRQLLSVTGGILQGMSGSPILQGGKIVGAVTHVFINDPTRGFGISIDKMLEN